MKKIAAVALMLVMVFTLTGCELSKFMPSYWDGMTKNQTIKYVCDELEEKYGEEFTVIKIGKTGLGDLWACCSPKADESLVFEVNVDAYGTHSREMLDVYIQTIVAREMRDKIDNVLSRHCNNYAAEVYVSGLARGYDSGIRLTSEATIENFTEALPNDNLSIVWIAFDKDEIGDDYDIVKVYLEEFVKEFFFQTAGFNCGKGICKRVFLYRLSGGTYRA